MSNLIVQKFEEYGIRIQYYNGELYLCIPDTITALTDSPDSAARWRKLKQKLKAEGSQTVTNCHAFKLTAPDGKKRLTDMANIETLFRIIQSVNSPKAEPFKLWLASLGDKAIKEEINKRPKPIRDQSRIDGIQIRNEETDSLKLHGFTMPIEYAIITRGTHSICTGTTPDYHKKVLALNNKEPLRDYVSPQVRMLLGLAEHLLKEEGEKRNAYGLDAYKQINREIVKPLILPLREAMRIEKPTLPNPEKLKKIANSSQQELH